MNLGADVLPSRCGSNGVLCSPGWLNRWRDRCQIFGNVYVFCIYVYIIYAKYESARPATHPPVRLPVRPSAHPSIRPSIRPPVRPHTQNTSPDTRNKSPNTPNTRPDTQIQIQTPEIQVQTSKTQGQTPKTSDYCIYSNIYLICCCTFFHISIYIYICIYIVFLHFFVWFSMFSHIFYIFQYTQRCLGSSAGVVLSDICISS